MKEKMYITGAPVGATPKYINPIEPKFIMNFLLDYLVSSTKKNKILQVLIQDGWEKVDAGGLSLQSGYHESITMTDLNALSTAEQQIAIENLTSAGWLNKNNEWINPRTPDNKIFKIEKNTLLLIQSRSFIRKIVLQLTTYGWQVNNNGDLVWPYEKVHSYLPPKMVTQIKSLCPAILDSLLESGWVCRPAGYWQPGKARSPYLPITPEKIIEECHLSLREGAAIVHIHTRDTSDKQTYYIPGLGATLSISAQTNHIDIDQYDKIIPAILEQDPSGIINLSTSVRGDKVDFDSPLRRAHLKPYSVRKIVPDSASFSPGHILFQTGGGYDNPPTFINKQFNHFKTYGIRPEVEVFNNTILNNIVTTYKTSLLAAGTPPLFMLVAGVDQHKKDSNTSTIVDDSLIPIEIHQRISELLQEDNSISHTDAVNLAVEYLLPIVNKIRQHFHQAKISILMPGLMQSILVETALQLKLNGIRVGLEDALTVSDKRVPGGIRKALGTYEQVRAIRLALEARGVVIATSEQLRDTLGIPREDIRVFHAVIAALKPYTANVCNISSMPKASIVLSILAPLAKEYYRRENVFIAEIMRYLEKSTYDIHSLSQKIQNSVRDYGLYFRLFIEEKDRYFDHAHLTFPDIYTPQAINFIRELLHERHHLTTVLDEAINQYSRTLQLPSLSNASYKIALDQFKEPALRFLEYLISIPCRYNVNRTDVTHLEIRQHPNYSAIMAILFNAIHELTLSLRKKSNADTKIDGLVWYVTENTDHEKITPIKESDLAETISQIDWVVLPSTPTTHYPLGLKLSTGLTNAFYRFLTQNMTESNHTTLKLLSMTHSGLDANGEPIIESSMLYSRFALNTDRSGNFSSYSASLIYDRLLLPRLVEHPSQLAYTSRGQVIRDKDGLPLYQDGRKAKRISYDTINRFPLLKLLAHSSGITTAQQLDNLIHHDACKLGFSIVEQRAFFKRILVISFASASDIHLHHLGSNVIDITAFNDIRSLAGTTTRDYLIEASESKKYVEETLKKMRLNANAPKYDYAHAIPTWMTGEQGKILVRLKNVFLIDDPARLHDGHSIKRYLECSPIWLRKWFTMIHNAPKSFGANDIILYLQKMNGKIELSSLKPKPLKIAIIGMGCSGTFVLQMLAKYFKKNDNVEILLFEKSSQMGAGLPYGEQFNDDSFILNMESSLLSGNPDNRGEFRSWLKKMLGISKNKIPLHVERKYMGMYLEALVKSALALLQEKNISYTIIQDTVSNIIKNKNNYCLITQVRQYETDRIVLATGHLPKISPFPNEKKYIANPYHSLDELKKIPQSANVGILGSKLTAVDIAILLRHHGIKRMAMFSKSGRLPLVCRERSPNHTISTPTIPNKWTLLAFWKEIKKRMRLQDVTYPGFINCKDEHIRLALEIQQADTPQHWQICLDESKEIVDKYWSKLALFQKNLFLSKYKGLWMSYRHPMPIQNAININEMLKAGELQIHANYRSVTPLPTSDAFKIELHNTSFQVDYIIDATGTPSDLRCIDSPLIHNLLNSGFITQHEIGGIELNTETHELKNMTGVFAIGQLTWGKIFYVSAMERLLKHACTISSHLVSSLHTEAIVPVEYIQENAG